MHAPKRYGPEHGPFWRLLEYWRSTMAYPSIEDRVVLPLDPGDLSRTAGVGIDGRTNWHWASDDELRQDLDRYRRELFARLDDGDPDLPVVWVYKLKGVPGRRLAVCGRWVKPHEIHRTLELCIGPVLAVWPMEPLPGPALVWDAATMQAPEGTPRSRLFTRPPPHLVPRPPTAA
jgi:hypothetical protein